MAISLCSGLVETHPDRDTRLAEMIRSACEALVREADTRSSKLRGQHDAKATIHRFNLNEATAINKLPNELLTTILTLAARDEWGSRPFPKMLRDLTVCKRWWAIIKTTPAIWANFQEGMSLQQLEISLERSKGTMLNFYSMTRWETLKGGGAGWILPSPSESDAFCDIALENLDRIQDLVVSESGGSDNWAMRSLVRKALASSTLRDLTLFSRERSLFDLDNGPTFQHITLIGAAVDWGSVRLRGLRTLSLIDIVGRGSRVPSIEQVIAVIASSPNLEELTMKSVSMSGPEEIAPLEQSVSVALPSMRTLHLEGIPFGMYSAFITRFRLTGCSSIRLNPTKAHDTSSQGPADAAALELLERHDYLLGATPTIYVDIYHGGKASFPSLEITTQEHEALEADIGTDFKPLDRRTYPSGMSICFGCGGGMDVARRARETILRARFQSGQQLPQVHVTVDTGSKRSPSVEQILAFDMAEILTVVNHGVEDILPLLVDGRDMNGAWPFPDLKELDLTEASGLSMSRVRDVVKARWVARKSKKTPKVPGQVTVQWSSNKGDVTEHWCPSDH